MSPATWPGYAALIERHGGVFGGCWCLAFHAGTKGGSFAERRALKERLVAEGRSHAGLVFDGADCIGWAQFGRVAELPAIKARRAYEAGRGDDPLPDWRITCFFVDKAHRRQGVAARALEAALAEIAREGGGVVEAYPEALEGQKTAAGFLWGGMLGLFERAGFAPIRKIGLHRWVVRKTIEGRRS
ncbi:GNAT family N-acetyltransferase [Limimaricola sp.]|uniref:GNAT family N-acetyltransferase n=1 Tax=Limimaricola sp. TaxID=2211665 RepID=UPI0025C6326F|nr:GNAT family N-acetyltransferase [Limimaricola sp.]